MGQARNPYFALVVEDDQDVRAVLAMLLEESELNVIECESAEAALGVMEKLGPKISLLLTDVRLAGVMDGIRLAKIAKRSFPDMHVIVTSGTPVADRVPVGAKFIPKPLLPLEVLREAAKVH